MKSPCRKLLGEAAIGVLVGVAAFHVVFALLAKAAVVILVLSGPVCTGIGPPRTEEDRRFLQGRIRRIQAAPPFRGSPNR